MSPAMMSPSPAMMSPSPSPSPPPPSKWAWSPEEWPVAVDLGLFVCVAAFCLFEIWRNHRMMQRVPSLVKSNAGFSVWKWFHIFLFFANSTRAVALVVEIYLDDSVRYDLFSWYITLAHTLPDLLFLSTYSLLILFWAQLYYKVTFRGYARLKPVFLFINVVVYAALIAMCVYTQNLSITTNSDKCDGGACLFRKYTLYLIGSVYVLGLLGMLYYGVKVAHSLRPKPLSYAYPARQMLLRRVMLLCAMCVTVFAMRATYCLLTATDILPNKLGYIGATPDSDVVQYRYVIDGVEYFVVELVPSVIILLLTRKRDTADSGSSAYSSRYGDGGNGQTESYAASYQPMEDSGSSFEAHIGPSSAGNRHEDLTWQHKPQPYR